MHFFLQVLYTELFNFFKDLRTLSTEESGKWKVIHKVFQNETASKLP